jgi:hypothetical protein
MDTFRNSEFRDAAQGARSAGHKTYLLDRRSGRAPSNAAVRPKNGFVEVSR